MVAIGDDNAIYLLAFAQDPSLDGKIERLKKARDTINCGSCSAIESIKAELQSYFKGSLQNFKTPLKPIGSEFQKLVWHELMRTPYGLTRSYCSQAHAIGRQTAVRAVANANGANNIAIAIPCHRIIGKNGDIGGYSAGVERKKWLIEHESRF